jgi:hypothetical protein
MKIPFFRAPLAGLLALVLAAPARAEDQPGDPPVDPAPAAPAAAEEAPQGEAFPIKFQRALATGYRFREKTTARYIVSRLVESNGNTRKLGEESFAIRFNARQEVLDATPRGSAKAYLLKFDELVKLTNGEDGAEKVEVLLEPGTLVNGRAEDDGSVFRSGDRRLDDSLQGILADLFGMTDADHPVGSDEIYGSEKPRHIGERWPINEAKAMAWVRDDGDPLAGLALVSGETTLVKRHVVDGVDCLQIGHTLSIRRTSPLGWGLGQMALGGLNGGERQFVHGMILDLPLDQTLHERGYRGYKRTRQSQVDPGSSEIQIFITESHYDTWLAPLGEEEWNR